MLLCVHSRDKLKISMTLSTCKKGLCWFFKQSTTMSAALYVFALRFSNGTPCNQATRLEIICRFSLGGFDICKGLCWQVCVFEFFQISLLQETQTLCTHPISQTLCTFVRNISLIANMITLYFAVGGHFSTGLVCLLARVLLAQPAHPLLSQHQLQCLMIDKLRKANYRAKWYK